MVERLASEAPRVLNLQQYTAAREPELRGLWEALKSLGRLDGSKLLPRQLRRRATSHRRYITKRRPNNKFLSKQQQQQQQQQQQGQDSQHAQHAQQDGTLPTPSLSLSPPQAAAAAAGDVDTDMPDADQPTPAEAAAPGATAAAAAAGTHRPLNRRQRRRTALLQMQLTQGSCCQDTSDAAATASPRKLETHIWHARRMQMCHRYGHILAAGAVGRGRGSRSFLHHAISNAPPPKPGSRYYKPSGSAAAAAGSSSSSTTMGSTTSPAAAKVKQTKAICHDASYWCCLELRGQQQQLIALLMHLTDAAELEQNILHNPAVTLGQQEVGLVMYEPGRFPRGVIGPVKVMWHWQQQQQQQVKEKQQQQVLEQQQQQSRRALKRQQQEEQRQQQQRTLWLWSHAAYFKQVHDVIQQLLTSHDAAAAAAAAAAANVESSSSSNVCRTSVADKYVSLQDVTMTSLCSNLRRLEVAGPDADYVIRSVFQQQLQQQQQFSAAPDKQRVVASLSSCTAPSSSSSMKQPTRHQSNRVWQELNQVPMEIWRHLPDGCVLGINATDPRLAKPPRISATPNAAAAAAAAGGGGSSEASKTLRSLIAGWPQNGRLWVSAAKPLLLNPTKLATAAPEVLVSIWRQQQQQAALGLRPGWQQQQQGGGSSSSNMVVCDLSGVKLSSYGITSYIAAASSSSSSSGGQNASSNTGADKQSSSAAAAAAELPFTCPVLLIRSNLAAAAASASAAAAAAAGSSPSWSVVLPAGWVLPFWMTLVQSGAKPAGLREWSWLAAVTQVPLPPLDYPDSAAAAAAAWQQQHDVAAAAAKRPLGRYNMQDNWLPFLDWKRVGYQLMFSNTTPTTAAAAGSSNGSSVPHVSVCWAAARQLQAAAAAAKQKQRKHRAHLRKAKGKEEQQQQGQGQQQQQQGQQQQQQSDALRPITATPMEQPQPLQLLPPGWYVARSWKVLLSALPSAAAAAAGVGGGGCGDKFSVVPQRPAQPAAVAVPFSVLASGQYRHTAAARALRKGFLAWAPSSAATVQTAAVAAGSTSVQQIPQANAGFPPSAAAAVAAAAAAAVDDGEHDDQREQGGDLMDVDDAAAVADDDDGIMTLEQQQHHHHQQQQQYEQQQQQDQCLVRVSVRVIGKGRCQQGALLLSQDLPGSSSGSSSSPDGTGSSLVTLLGYVTTAVPRGAPASLYPGGLGFCSARCLWGLRSKDVSSSSSRVLRAWCLNPGSIVLRRVELTVLLDH